MVQIDSICRAVSVSFYSAEINNLHVGFSCCSVDNNLDETESTTIASNLHQFHCHFFSNFLDLQKSRAKICVNKPNHLLTTSAHRGRHFGTHFVVFI